MEDKNQLAEMVAKVVSSYVSNNEASITDLPEVIASVHRSFARITGDHVPSTTPDQPPAVPIKQSISENHLVCLEDGMEFKSLKRHLRSHHDLSPEQYRKKWGLPADYPMVAPSYSLKRSRLARENGLGRPAEEN